MSKVSIEFDTVEKTLAVTIDGAKVENVESVDFWKSYSDENKFRVGINTLSEDKENGMHVATRVFASESETELTPLQRDVLEYVGR